jgi:ribonucleotide reductase beta subunit family protein with ferritin-like domain
MEEEGLIEVEEELHTNTYNLTLENLIFIKKENKYERWKGTHTKYLHINPAS